MTRDARDEERQRDVLTVVAFGVLLLAMLTAPARSPSPAEALMPPDDADDPTRDTADDTASEQAWQRARASMAAPEDTAPHEPAARLIVASRKAAQALNDAIMARYRMARDRAERRPT